MPQDLPQDYTVDVATQPPTRGRAVLRWGTVEQCPIQQPADPVQCTLNLLNSLTHTPRGASSLSSHTHTHP